MERPLRVGIVGASPDGQGWAPISHFPALRMLPQFEIAAICTAHAKTAAAASQAYGVKRAFHDFHAMVREPDIDVVSVVVKAPNHHEVVMAALEAGKHVYCEWPLGANTLQAEEMAALASKQRVKAIVGLQARGDPVISCLRDLIASGYVGKVVAVNMSMFTGGVLERPATRLWDRDAAQGVSVLTVRGIHSMDSLCYCLGEFVEVAAKVTTQVKRWRVTGSDESVDVDAADNVALTGVLASGAIVSVHAGTVPYHGSGWRMEIYGDEGSIRASSSGAPQRDANQLIGAKRGAALALLTIPERYTRMPAGTPAGPPQNVGHLYLRLARAIHGDTPVTPDFALAVDRHRLIDAIQRSSDERRTVELPAGG